MLLAESILLLLFVIREKKWAMASFVAVAVALSLVLPTISQKIYEEKAGQQISERHRHRYEVNIAYRERIEQSGLTFSGLSPDGVLPELCERADHPWFVGVQFHPELKSRPFAPHPLFASFIAAALHQSRLV